MILALFALLSLGWQSLVVQTHVHHDDPAIGWTDLGDAGHHLTAPAKDPTKAPLDCPLCRQAAQAGAYLAAGGGIVLAAPEASLVPLVLRPVAWVARHRPTGWHSRGPPTLS